jgi:DNA repair protein RadC
MELGLAKCALVTCPCPRCGFLVACNDDTPAVDFFRPWHVRGRGAVNAYVESLGQEAHEWLLALYVDDSLQLLAVDTVAKGDASSVELPTWRLLERGHALRAKGFILVHNHPSGDARPSQTDVRATMRLSRVSDELNMPLLDHLIVAGDEVHAID